MLDTIYLEKHVPADFSFNSRVAAVFDDMVQRSVPGYDIMQESLDRIVRSIPGPVGTVLDLGCATGTSMEVLARKFPGTHLIGYDNSAPMIEQARQRLAPFEPETRVDLYCADVCEVVEFPPADVVLLNLTLQFIRPLRRKSILTALSRAVRPGGVLVLMEKVIEDDSSLTRRLISIHHEFKREQGYSDLEIARKREDIENVLIPLSVSENEELLRDAGFNEVGCVIKVLNFALIAGFKSAIEF
ncbi:carboxy-S-adenosyl-L-methionine synthase CmoA [Streptacidiphilus pinicola]|uniref:Carboxy-S-adenosyl-L-methionine synthase n=1 Tax=Streptacidiphilus pinicola TaxID=2219663 RepID=A0A2X0IP39_9ACTN|nr:carboxy-S-adenosyl-L-methionine synthase CmoA [Streptacidiphilus pinicola]RAG85001.1 carboxy-S-adenosyl-L-methionine synthase CmoA [Streptacidiphilus pinicola]